MDELLTIVSNPVADPKVVGLKSRLRLADWPELSVSGSATPDRVKPVPVSVTELMTTGAPPVELNVMVWVAGTFNVTLPKEIDVALMVNTGTGALS